MKHGKVWLKWFSIIWLFSVTTPNINAHLALPFKKRPVESSAEFKEIWRDKKSYVAHVSGAGGVYQQRKEQRKSEEFPWPLGSPEPLSSSEHEGDLRMNKKEMIFKGAEAELCQAQDQLCHPFISGYL